ncbi:Trace amine-associated receptor 7a [Merluccius polli]|uniref:Trace amine-associated receptor 7a n=1 Tax=Merluccius polli TaxID=89951 RepID=A0AA47ND55_MERPO|nr:Trace amine-associated receptor 7a [Merluccius polli]
MKHPSTSTTQQQQDPPSSTHPAALHCDHYYARLPPKMTTTEEGATTLCFPQRHNDSCRRPVRPHSEAVFYYTVLSSIALLTVVLNLLVVISISHFRKLHTPTNLLLLSLAVSDLLVGLLVMPVETVRITDSCWRMGTYMCSLASLLSYILTSASVGNVVLISVERYVAICYPLHYHTMVTQQRTKACVGLCWFSSVLYNGAILKDHLAHSSRLTPCQGECVVVVTSVTDTVDLVFTFIGPCIVIPVLYLRVLVVAVAQARAMHLQVAMTAPGGADRKSERKAARTLGILVLVFLACLCPYFYPVLAEKYTTHSDSQWLWSIMAWMVYINSTLNPLIYALFYPWFRRAIRLIVTLRIFQDGSAQTSVL